MAGPASTRRVIAESGPDLPGSVRKYGTAAPASLCDALDRLLTTGVVVVADATLTVADIDLLRLQCQIVVSSAEESRGPL
ncbi:gas vesicle protein [Methylococcus sp. Mc7]|uniref:gas vesicle protein n=1 Tax=Methylococcus sp. Mc7 TaxID=2860258 RepID=UPI00351D345B